MLDQDRKTHSEAERAWLFRLVDALPAAAVYRLAQSPAGNSRFEHASSGFERMFGLSPELLRQDATPLFEMMGAEEIAKIAPLKAVATATWAPFDYEGPVLLASGGTRWFQWHSRPSKGDDGTIYWDGVCLDVTQRKEMEFRVARLEGILPICAYCKKIRDKGEQWVRLEEYVTDHSAAKFTHGMCPDCIAEHYGKEYV